MRAVIQRVKGASVRVNGEVVGACLQGLMILVGVMKDDSEVDAEKMAKKIANMRIFADMDGKTNLSVKDVYGSALVVSQFTLAADVKKGNRPSFAASAPPEEAERLYEYFADALRKEGVPVEQGVFGASMQVAIQNDGPFTITYDTKD